MMSPQQLYEIGLVFDARPEPGLYFPTAVSELLRLRLRAAFEQRGGLPVLSGEAGSGKTLLAAMALRNLPPRWAHVAQLRFSTIAGDDLLRAIAHAFGMALDGAAAPADGIAAELALRQSRGGRSLLLVDDAQGLTPEALRLLHRLSRPVGAGEALLAVVLVGSPELRQRLREATLADIAADFHPRFETGPFDAPESIAFVRDRLSRCRGEALPAFTPAALDEIHFRAQGVPGRINLLCRELLHEALLMDDAAPIGPVRVAAEADQQRFACPPRQQAAAPSAPPLPVLTDEVVLPVRRSGRLLLAGLTLGALLGAVLWLAPGDVPAPEPLSAVPDPQPQPQPQSAQASVTVPTATTSVIVPPSLTRHASTPRKARPDPVRAALPAPQLQRVTRPPRECAAVLTQLSLGEPLNSKQKHMLETLCR